MSAVTAPERQRGHEARRVAQLDWVLTAAALALSVLGCVLIASAGAATSGSTEAKKQLLALLAALVVSYGAARVEPRALRAWAPALYVVSVALMLAAFTPAGVEIAGARAWVALPGGFTLQPSEFAKIALVLALAATLSGGRHDHELGTDTVVRALALAAVPLVLVVAGNDTGSALIITGVVAVMLLVAGVSWRWLAGLTAAGAVAAVSAVSLGLLADYQTKRLTAFLDPGADPWGAGLNTIQARVAIGDGGLLGHGLFQGPQTQGGFVPVNDSDFVFTVAAEELGLVGAAGVLALLAVVIWRGLRIAFRARDMFGRLVAVGIVAWFSLQAFENLGMNLGVMPVTGVTLPFVSYGGSSMIAAWLGIGLLQLVRAQGSGSSL